MAKFKGRISCKQYVISKAIKWVFKWWCWCCSKRYLYEFDLYLGKKEKSRAWVKKAVVLDLYKTHIVCFILTILILQHWLRRFSIREYTALVHFKVTGKVTRYEKRWHKFFIWQTMWLLRNGLIIVEWQWLVYVLWNVIRINSYT